MSSGRVLSKDEVSQTGAAWFDHHFSRPETRCKVTIDSMAMAETLVQSQTSCSMPTWINSPGAMEALDCSRGGGGRP
jgi:hypothetical protein